ncbi:TATA box-binding protein-like 1 [Paramacrobiotus metropolitanus]|uniref:TATA box-binding protein-like 1 n=1 Tax=Paramacrobiotus metropolitanus TaxID=2943436 RepID=UPI0024457B21|nr:TATA box-binding protein-like 1 [Paramacrobiotus metropolitanus]XP_055354729.1 TATA box-binding protein-like 1 [Paramacrobiotus metropolitanus]XP_055354730.1 TATA box-binding protein-like 1 [Paramacrobiotus metropolitanus]XP_055354731.1 TATA box-binding protein-like 1 [Paramacrobiotus metropolitanus]
MQKCGFGAKFFKVINCLTVAYFTLRRPHRPPQRRLPHEVQCEPELHPVASWKLPEVGGQMQVFQTGNTTITAPNALSARKTLASIYAKLYEFRKPKDSVELSRTPSGARKGRKRGLSSGEADAEVVEFQAELKALKLAADC